MSPALAIDACRGALWAALWLSLPLLTAGFLVGTAISLIQVLTSLQDQSAAALPRLVVMFIALLLLMPWMVSHAMTYAVSVWGNLARYAS